MYELHEINVSVGKFKFHMKYINKISEWRKDYFLPILLCLDLIGLSDSSLKIWPFLDFTPLLSRLVSHFIFLTMVQEGQYQCP